MVQISYGKWARSHSEIATVSGLELKTSIHLNEGGDALLQYVKQNFIGLSQGSC